MAKQQTSDAPPWKRKNPKKAAGAKSRKLTAAQRGEARARARAAGRPYPNLVVVHEHVVAAGEDWLIRHYGFDASELTTTLEPNLRLNMSPKLAWALRHPEQFPVDVNLLHARSCSASPA